MIGAAYLFTLFCLGLGVATTYRYLKREVARIEPAELIGILASEAPALIWFTWYFVKHYLLGRPVAPVKRGNGLPWWHDFHMALPLMVMAVFAGFLGGFLVGLASLLDWILGER